MFVLKERVRPLSSNLASAGRVVALAWVTRSPESRCVGGINKEALGFNTRTFDLENCSM